MKEKYKIEKLVRDLFVENCKKTEGSDLCFENLDKKQYEKALRKKLLEEAHEVFLEKTPQLLKEEIGDLMEVLDCLIDLYKFKRSEIKKIKNEKKKDKGSFKRGIFCKNITIPIENKDYWSDYIRNKYKKINEN